MKHELPEDKKLLEANGKYDWKTQKLTIEFPRQVSKFTVICEPAANEFVTICESWRIPPNTPPVTSVQVTLTQLHPETGYKFILKDGDELLGWFKKSKKYKPRRSKSDGEQVTSLPTTPQANASPAAGPAAPPLVPRAAREPAEKKRVNNDAAQEVQLPRKAQMTTKAGTLGTAPSVPAPPPKAALLVVAPPAPVPPGLAAVPSSPQAATPDPEPEAPAAAPPVPEAAHTPVLAPAALPKLELNVIAGGAGSLGWHWPRPNLLPEGTRFEWNLLHNKEAVKSGTTMETYATFVASDEHPRYNLRYALSVRVQLNNGAFGPPVKSKPKIMKESVRNAVIPQVRRAMWAAFYPGQNGESSMIKHDCLGCRAQGKPDARIAKLDPLLSNVHAGHIISHARGGPEGKTEQDVWDFMPICPDCNSGTQMGTTNAIQWFYDTCKRNNNFEVLYEVLCRLRNACQQCADCPLDILNGDIVEFAVKMYHEGHEHYEKRRDSDGEFLWKKLGGGFSLKDDGAFRTAFKSKAGNQGKERVESDDVTASLYPAIAKLGTRVSEIENRITNEREIEQIMSQATMRLMEKCVDPELIKVLPE